MATVTIQKRKRKNGNSYVITFKNPLTGEKKYYKTFRKHRVALQEANDLRALLDSGKKPILRPRLSPLTFREVAESLKKEWQDRLIKGAIKEKTVEDYIIWLNILKRTFEKKMLCEISEDDFRDYLELILENNSIVSHNKYLSIIKMVCKHGLKINALVDDPSKEIKKLSEKKHERDRFLFPIVP
jgi:hypothetical protein